MICKSYTRATLSSKLIQTLYRLTLKDGTMRNDLKELLRGSAEGRVIVARFRNKIIGWCLVSRECKNHRFYVAVYVRKEYRRRGIGTLLTNKAKQYAAAKNRGIICQCWDERSFNFFTNMNLKKIKIKINVGVYGDMYFTMRS